MNFLDLLDPAKFAENPDILLLALPAAAGLMLVLIAFLVGDGSSDRFKRRVKRVQTQDGGPMTTEQMISIRRKTEDSSIAWFDAFIKRALPRPELLRHRIARSGLKMTLGTYLTINLVLAIAAGGGCYFVSFIPKVALPLIGLFVGAGIPHLILSFLIARRRKKFIGNFPEAIDLMVRGLKSGLPVGESIKIVGEEVADPVGSEFKMITDEVKMGKKLETALTETAERLDMQEFNFMTVSMSIQSETGGNLAETLSNLSEVLRRRRQLKLKIKALSSEAKASAYIIGSLPFIMSVLIHLSNQQYLLPLVQDPRGNFIVFLGFLCFLVGAGVMYKMVKFEI